MITVTVIIPVYNEDGTILEILQRVADQRIDDVSFEVIVIDDGSSDGTVELLERNPELYGKLIKMPVNRGKGAAVKAGLAEASGDYVLFQDADLEYDPADYHGMLLPVLRFGADLVIGSRMVAPRYTRVSYFWHKVGNRLITLIFNVLNNTTFTDIYTCYLMYRRRLVDVRELDTDGWQQHAEILSRAVARSSSMYEVPISYNGRTYDEGKKIKAHHIVAVIWIIIKRGLLR